MSIQVLDHLSINAIFLGDTDDMLLNKLDSASLLLKFLELRSWNLTLWTLCWGLCTLVHITANGAYPFSHNDKPP